MRFFGSRVTFWSWHLISKWISLGRNHWSVEINLWTCNITESLRRYQLASIMQEPANWCNSCGTMRNSNNARWIFHDTSWSTSCCVFYRWWLAYGSWQYGGSTSQRTTNGKNGWYMWLTIQMNILTKIKARGRTYGKCDVSTPGLVSYLMRIQSQTWKYNRQNHLWRFEPVTRTTR